MMHMTALQVAAELTKSSQQNELHSKCKRPLTLFYGPKGKKEKKKEKTCDLVGLHLQGTLAKLFSTF